mmetsp:Transcript_24665/g.37537  ORF Transcript_24665/g.37537 Transcript_24665/m.37537 type:complete len:380 (+) Transcript_24665:763-1902(+)
MRLLREPRRPLLPQRRPDLGPLGRRDDGPPLPALDAAQQDARGEDHVPREPRVHGAGGQGHRGPRHHHGRHRRQRPHQGEGHGGGLRARRAHCHADPLAPHPPADERDAGEDAVRAPQGDQGRDRSEDLRERDRTRAGGLEPAGVRRGRRHRGAQGGGHEGPGRHPQEGAQERGWRVRAGLDARVARGAAPVLGEPRRGSRWQPEPPDPCVGHWHRARGQVRRDAVRCDAGARAGVGQDVREGVCGNRRVGERKPDELHQGSVRVHPGLRRPGAARRRAHGQGHRHPDLHRRDHLPSLRLVHQARRGRQGQEEGGGAQESAVAVRVQDCRRSLRLQQEGPLHPRRRRVGGHAAAGDARHHSRCQVDWRRQDSEPGRRGA